MENTSPTGGNLGLLGAILLGTISFLITNAELVIKVMVSAGSFGVATMGIRHYYYSTKKIKQEIELNKLK